MVREPVNSTDPDIKLLSFLSEPSWKLWDANKVPLTIKFSSIVALPPTDKSPPTRALPVTSIS